MSDDPIHIPQTWTRVAAIDINHGTFAAVFAAYDRGNDCVYLYDEYKAPLSAIPVHAEAVRARGKWIPVLFDMESLGRAEPDGLALARRLGDLGLDLSVVPLSTEAGVSDVIDRLATGRLRVFNTCQRWGEEQRKHRRDEEGAYVDEDAGLIRATGLVVGPGLGIAKSEAHANSDAEGHDMGDSTRNQSTGY